MRKQSIEEKAVLRKIESGRRLSSDDKIIQARMRSIQRKHLEGQTTGIPANAQTQILPNAFALTEAVRALAASMYDGVTPPNFGEQNDYVDARIRTLQTGAGNASFSFKMRSYVNLVDPLEFAVSGSFVAGPLHMVGSGPAGSSGTTAAGSGSTTTTGSGVGVSGGGTVSGSGATGGGGVSYGQSTTTTVSGSGSGSTGVSGAVMRETYSAKIIANFRIDATYVADVYNPFSWGGAIGGQVRHANSSQTGTCADCGTAQFDVTHATGS